MLQVVMIFCPFGFSIVLNKEGDRVVMCEKKAALREKIELFQ